MPRDTGRSKLIGIAALVLSLAAIAGCGGSGGGAETQQAQGGGESAGMPQMRVAMNTASSALPVWVAEEKGFDKDAGIDLESSAVTNIAQLPATLGQQYDIALTVTNIYLNAVAQGIPVVAVAGDLVDTKKNPSTIIMVAPDSEVQDLADLSGKTVATPSIAGTATLTFQQLLRDNGIDPASVKMVQAAVPTMADQVKAGVVAAALQLQPFATQMEQSGFRRLGGTFRSISDYVRGATFWIANRDYAEQHAADIDKFREVMSKSIDFIKNNPEEARAILQAQTKLPKELIKAAPLPPLDVELKTEDISSWIPLMRKYADFQGTIDEDTLVLR